jgi:hypothetical protein
LNGTVNPHGADTTYYFRYGTSTTYSSQTLVSDAGSETAVVSVPTAITGLNGSTKYHYQLVATNINGTSYGGDRTFTTPAPTAPPAPPAPQATL